MLVIIFVSLPVLALLLFGPMVFNFIVEAAEYRSDPVNKAYRAKQRNAEAAAEAEWRQREGWKTLPRSTGREQLWASVVLASVVGFVVWGCWHFAARMLGS